MNSQLFREELERVVGDSVRESGADGSSALLSDVMNIKSGSKYRNIYKWKWCMQIFIFDIFNKWKNVWNAYNLND